MRTLPCLLLLATVAAACAPVAATQTPSSAAIPLTQAAATPIEAGTQAPVPSSAALPIATSRGLALHATDPATVNLASGTLQLIEFFRFT
jgi:hypothetical protein